MPFLLFYVSSPEEVAVGAQAFSPVPEKGNHVVTSSGIYGVIKVLRDKYVELEIAPKVVIKVEKTAIHHGDVELIDAETAKSWRNSSWCRSRKSGRN